MTQHQTQTAHTAAPAHPQGPPELLRLLHGMPWTLEHRPQCPAASAGPCTCGAEQLRAEIARLSAT